MVHIEWNVKSESVKLVKDDGSQFILTVGDFITYAGRDQGVRIERFAGDSQPIGLEYLPWRGTRWATPVFSIRGNPRFIICLPYGIEKYGQHIDWNTARIECRPDIL
jgi:hypothetical protein